MYRIAVIGAGQLGSRHLQALAKCEFPAEITVVDPARESLSLSRDRFREAVPGEQIKGVSYFTSLESLPREIDLCIIATTSTVRAQVTESLLHEREVRYIIFEKVLFQKPLEYERISVLLVERGVGAWVNCPRRVYPFYNDIRGIAGRGGPTLLFASGGEWGLACNSIHLIDLLCFFTGETEYETDTSLLDRDFLVSKRDGFLECTGTLCGTFACGSRFVLHSSRGSSAPPVFHISSGSSEIVVDEANHSAAVCSGETGWSWEKKEMKVPFQSELTHEVVKDILLRGECGLTPFGESVRLHLPLVRAFMAHFGAGYGIGADTCPIT